MFAVLPYITPTFLLLLSIPSISSAKTSRPERKREGKGRESRSHCRLRERERGSKKGELKTSGGAEERAGIEGEGRGRLSSEEGPPFG